MAGIILTIEVDDKGSVKVKQFSDETKKAFDEMKKGPEAAKSGIVSLSEGWVGLTAKVTLATGIIYGASKALSSFVDEAAEAEQIEKHLQFALDTAGYSWTSAKSAVDQFASSIMETTRYSDEQARQALTDMMMYTNEYAKAETGAKLAMDMSTRTGQDLTTATRLIGMAMTGNVEMLGRYLPQLRNLDSVLGADASMAEKAAYALKTLQDKFGGTAAADLNTYSGKVAQFKNQWSELKEEWGTHLLPILGTVLERLTGIAKVLSTKPKAGLYEQLAEWEGLGSFIETTTPYPTESEKRFTGWGLAGGKKDVFTEDYSDLLKKSADESAKAWGDYAQAELDALGTMQSNRAADAKDEAAFYKENVQMLEDYLADRAKIEEEMVVGAANNQIEIDEINKKFEESEWEKLSKHADLVKQFRSEMDSVKSGTEGFMSSLSSGLSSAWSTNLTSMIKGTQNFSDAVKNIFSGMADSVISSVTKMLANLALFGNVKGEYKSGSGALGGFVSLIGSIGSLFSSSGSYSSWNWGGGADYGAFGMQEGGIVTRPTLAMLGEGNTDEAVIPLENGKIPIEGGSGGTTYIIQNYNQVNDPNTFQKLYGPVVKKLSRESAAEVKRFRQS